jgi:DNA polymerase
MELCKEYIHCKKCIMGERDKVFGSGNINADLMFIHISPGEDEESEMAPLAGSGGSIFNALLEKVGLKRNEVYVSNLTLCRSVEADNINKNRIPNSLEVSNCIDRLNKEIYIIDPKVIVLLGQPPIQYLVRQDKTSLSNARGKVQLVTVPGKEGAIIYPALATWPIAYLLRNPSVVVKDPLHDCLCDYAKALELSKIYKEKTGVLV